MGMAPLGWSAEEAAAGRLPQRYACALDEGFRSAALSAVEGRAHAAILDFGSGRTCVIVVPEWSDDRCQKHSRILLRCECGIR